MVLTHLLAFAAGFAFYLAIQSMLPEAPDVSTPLAHPRPDDSGETHADDDDDETITTAFGGR